MKGRQRLPSTTNGAATRDGHAEVRFYESDRSLARMIADFLHEGFDDGSPGIVVSTPDQCAAIVRELTDRSVDVVALQRSHDLLLLDAGETLSTFMMDGRPDPRKFRDQMGHVLERACRGRTNCTVRIFGLIVDVLWQQGEREAAIRLEVLWNELADNETFSLLSGYAIGHFYKGASAEVPRDRHPHVMSSDGRANRIASVASDRDRRRLEGRRRR